MEFHAFEKREQACVQGGQLVCGLPSSYWFLVAAAGVGFVGVELLSSDHIWMSALLLTWVSREHLSPISGDNMVALVPTCVWIEHSVMLNGVYYSLRLQFTIFLGHVRIIIRFF